MNMRRSKKASLVIVITFVLLLSTFSLLNAVKIFRETDSDFPVEFSLSRLKEKIISVFGSEAFLGKDRLIDLNGLYARLSGRRLYNDVILMNNGMLTYNTPSLTLNASGFAEVIQDLNQFAADRDADFFYIQFPAKFDMENSLMPDGLGTVIPKETESFLSTLKTLDINVIDTLPLLSRTRADIEENFYRTDHHWKPSGAFKAFQMIIQCLKERYPDVSYDDYVTDPGNWTVHEIPNHFLGSHGVRVGRYFAGLDALEWMTPDFETNLTLEIPLLKEIRYGDYSEIFIRKEYLEENLDLLHVEPYFVYIGKNYALTHTYNPNASSAQKLLVIDDSYDRPLQTFLAMIFQQVDTIDPRNYKDSSIKKYIDQTHPDIVFLAVSNNRNILTDPGYFHLTDE